MTVIQPVLNSEQINQTVILARDIWQQHYLSIIGQAQIDYMLDKFQSQQAIKQQIDSGYLYYLVECEDENLAYLALVPDSSQSRLMISKIYVDQLARGKGLGKAMLEHTRQKAQELGLATVWLTVNIDNSDSIAWYLKQGFNKVDKVKADIGNGYFMDDYILELVV